MHKFKTMKLLRPLIIFGILFFAISDICKSQSATPSFSHSIGVSRYKYSSVYLFGATYSPRYNFLPLGRERTFSIGTHMTLGYAWHVRVPDAKSFAYDLPLLLEYNFGQGSEPNTRKKLGGYIGVGYGIFGVNDRTNFGTLERAEGFNLSGGVRVKINNQIPIGIRFSYMINHKNEHFMLGLGLYYTFGELKFY